MKTVNKKFYQTTDGEYFDTFKEASKHEIKTEKERTLKKIKSLKEKIEDIIPKRKKENIIKDKEFKEIISGIYMDIDHKYKVELYCDYSGKPLVAYTTKYHDSGHQYERSYTQRLSRILDRPSKIIKIGDIERCYCPEVYEKKVVPLIKANSRLIKSYLLAYHTGVIK